MYTSCVLCVTSCLDWLLSMSRSNVSLSIICGSILSPCPCWGGTVGNSSLVTVTGSWTRWIPSQIQCTQTERLLFAEIIVIVLHQEEHFSKIIIHRPLGVGGTSILAFSFSFGTVCSFIYSWRSRWTFSPIILPPASACCFFKGKSQKWKKNTTVSAKKANGSPKAAPEATRVWRRRRNS